MNFEQAITIFEAFDTWCRAKDDTQFTQYTPEQVLEAQAILLAVCRQVHLNSNPQNN